MTTRRAVPARWLTLLRTRVRERSFWLVQAGVLVAVALHALAELLGLPEREGLGAVVYVPPLLLVVPVSLASFRYGLEGGVLTSIWAAVLSIPNLLVWHPDGYEWLGDVVFLAVVLGLGVVVAVPVERERAERRRAEAAAAQLHDVRQEQLRTYVHEVTMAQEAERARISRDLHDDVAQQLVVLVRHLDALEAGGDLADIDDARRTASRALAEVRRTSRGLRPTVLDDLGLAPAIEWLAEDLAARNDVSTSVDVLGGATRLAAAVELALFRIAQEALRNVERHAAASHVAIELEFADARVRLAIRDDGRGFVVHDRATLSGSGRLGTIGMHERAELVGGELTLDSVPGGGTSVTVDVPTGAGGWDQGHEDLRDDVGSAVDV